MNIVLIGMRGAGKTTIGRLLSKKLNMKLIESDKLIEKNTKMKIAEIVLKNNWQKIRNFEEEVIKKASRLQNVIIASGGGVILRQVNIDNLKREGKLIYLKADVDTLVKRVKNCKNRPFLTKSKTIKEDMEKTFIQRKNLYQQAADFKVNTDGKSVEKVAKKIVKLLHLTRDHRHTSI